MKNMAFVLAVGLLLAADDPKRDGVKKEMAKFQGTWKFVSVEVDSQKMPDRAFTKATVVLKGDQWTVCEGKRCAAKLTVRLARPRNPRRLTSWTWTWRRRDSSGAFTPWKATT